MKTVLAADGRILHYDNDMVVRFLDKVLVQDGGYDVVFKAGVIVRV